ncbi:MAG TPA: hypothetical protein VGA80_14640 [Flavobacteriaceae bacterium]
MRKFNNREKDFLKLLEEISNGDLEFFSFFLQNKYFTKNKNSALFVLPQQKTALLFIRKNIFDNLKLRKEELKKFIEILSLVENLKANWYINLIPNPEAQNISMHIMYDSFDKPKQDDATSNINLNEQGMHLKFPDISKIYNSKNEIEFEGVKLEEHTYNLIMNNFMGLLFVSEELKDFVKKKFRTVEDIRYKNGQIATWTGLILALIFGLFGIYNPFDTNESINSNKQLNQLTPILENSKQILHGIHEVKKTIENKIESDSLLNEK